MIISCTLCGSELGTVNGGTLVHHDDGSHEFIPPFRPEPALVFPSAFEMDFHPQPSERESS